MTDISTTSMQCIINPEYNVEHLPTPIGSSCAGFAKEAGFGRITLKVFVRVML